MGGRTHDLITFVPNLWIILDIGTRPSAQRADRFDDRGSWPTRAEYPECALEFDPVPDKVYQLTLRYRLRPPELIQGGAHLLTREWDEVLITMAVQKGWEALEQWEKAGAQKQIVENQLATREEPVNLEDADSETTIWPAKMRW